MKKKYDYHMSGNMSSEGTLGLSLYFPDKDSTDEKKVGVLASVLAQSYNLMLGEGYLLPDTRFMSAKDVAEEHGHTRQYWEKLLKEGKIPFKETSAGRITTDLWVKGYLDNREVVDEYVRNINKVVDVITGQKKNLGKIECPKCKELQFDYAVNPNNVNGVCRAGCGFRINTTI